MNKVRFLYFICSSSYELSIIHCRLYDIFINPKEMPFVIPVSITDRHNNKAIFVLFFSHKFFLPIPQDCSELMIGATCYPCAPNQIGETCNETSSRPA